MKSMTKAAFIRSQPLTLKVQEVVERARSAGLVISPHQVYDVRKTERDRKAKGKRSVPRAQPERQAPGSVAVPRQAAEDLQVDVPTIAQVSINFSRVFGALAVLTEEFGKIAHVAVRSRS